MSRAKGRRKQKTEAGETKAGETKELASSDRRADAVCCNVPCSVATHRSVAACFRSAAAPHGHCRSTRGGCVPHALKYSRTAGRYSSRYASNSLKTGESPAVGAAAHLERRRPIPFLAVRARRRRGGRWGPTESRKRTAKASRRCTAQLDRGRATIVQIMATHVSADGLRKRRSHRLSPQKRHMLGRVSAC